MERSVAIKKLGNLLGKSFGYRVDPKAPDRDEREEARAKLKDATSKRDDLSKQMDERKMELLRGDEEYQRLRAEHTEARKERDALASTAHRYRFTVGKSNSIFFVVEAQGDSWEEVIAAVSKKRKAA